MCVDCSCKKRQCKTESTMENGDGNNDDDNNNNNSNNNNNNIMEASATPVRV